MILEDRFYGRYEIKESIICDLINSEEVQRMKEVSQLGVPDEFYHRKGFSRYEHSIGVFLLLRHCKASLDEQISGLLHDVSHPAFSHVYDWIFGDGSKEDHQDRIHEEMIAKSKLPKILAKAKIDYKKISNLKNFKLLERERPELCADRFDYLLRDPMTNPESAINFFNALHIYNGQMAFEDVQTAGNFGRGFLNAQLGHWGHPETVLRYHLFAEILKFALNDKIISNEDFFGTEKPIIEKLKNSENEEIRKRLKALSKEPRKLDYKLNDVNPSLVLKKKFRYVDPWYIQSSGLSVLSPGLVKLSDVDIAYRDRIKRKMEENEKGIRVDVFL